MTKYEVELTLTKDQLGTNPCNPNVLDQHIIQRQRKLILEKSQINKEVNKYLDALPIAQEKGEAEVHKLINKLENLTGLVFTSDDREKMVQGKLESLKETFGELDFTGTTVFFWDKKKDKPTIGNHMIYGFMKAASEAIGRTKKKKNATMLQSIAYTQSIINQHLTIDPQFISFDKGVKEVDDKPYFFQRSLRAMTAQGPRISLAKSEVVEAGAKLKFVMKVMDNSPLTLDVINS